MKNLILLPICILLSIPSIAQKKTAPSPKFELGIIESLESKILNEKRTLNIYLPEGYSAKDTLKYPVIYLLDGSADEDFIHIAGLVQYNTFPWIERMPKSIVVGIANIDRRRDFTSPTQIKEIKDLYPSAGASEKFIGFMEKELQPFIDKNFKTTPDRMIIGQSLGGLLATEILFTKPQLFNKYVIISPSLWWNDGELLKRKNIALEEHFNQKIDIYIGVGKEGLSPFFDNHVMEVDANVLYDKIKTSKNPATDVFFDYLPEEDHATVTHPAVFNAFRILYPKKKS